MNSPTFFKTTTYNKETLEQLWCSIIGDAHDSICGCIQPYAHLLHIIFPEGHKDLDKTVRQIIQRDLKCHSGGEGETNHGTTEDKTIESAAAATGPTENQGEDIIKDEELEELIAAANAAIR